MNEARKLEVLEKETGMHEDLSRLPPLVIERQTHKNNESRPGPSVDAPSIERTPVNSWDAPASAAPQLKQAPSLSIATSAAANSGTQLKAIRPQQQGRSFFGAMVGLFLFGLFAFAIGVSLAGAIALGMVDTVWVKETMKSAKLFATQIIQLFH